MSNYQPPLYSANYGSANQPNPNPPYLPPTFPNQYLQPDEGRANQGHMTGNYDAYGYNRAVPAFSAAALASGVPPLPLFQGWNQDPIPLPPYTTPTASQTGGQYNNYSNNAQLQQYYAPAIQPKFQQGRPQTKSFEHDLSEGEFDDNALTTSTPAVGFGAAQYQGNDGTGYVDTAQRAVYSRPQDYSSQQSYPANNYNYSPRDHSQPRRQQSDSYSPYASPLGAGTLERPNGFQQQSAHVPGHSQESTSAALPSHQYGWPQEPVIPSQPISITSTSQTTQNRENATQQSKATSQPLPFPFSSGINTSSDKSVSESRKKAQGAILNLWPYDVRYQTYIDEGFKEDIIGRLFDDLKMSRTSSKPSNPTESNSKSGAEVLQPNKTNTPALPAKSIVKATLAASTIDKEKATPLSITANGAVGSSKSTTQSSVEHVKTPLASAQTMSASMVEKDKALKSKMDALRKSREDRAQKAAAKSTPSTTSPNTSGQQGQLRAVDEELPAQKESSVQGSTSLSKSPSIPRNDIQSRAEFPISTSKPQTLPEPAPQASATQTQQEYQQKQAPAIPGLFLASAAIGPAHTTITQNTLLSPAQVNLRKRPVAADFDESSSIMAPFKRPFGQSRTDKPLVIDVSDEEIESEDEGVAMDLESIADESPAQSVSKLSEQHPLLIPALPTQNNFSLRKDWPSPPVSSAGTPPAPQQVPRGLFGRPEILQRKESEIEELKKKIAEAEAKRHKAKQTPSGGRTPRVLEAAAAEGKSSPQPHERTSTPVESSIPVQQLIDAADKKIALEQQRLAEVQAVEVAKMAEQKRLAAVEQKRLRREKVANEIAASKAAAEQELAIVAQKKAELAEAEANRQKRLDEQQKLLEEMQLLGLEEDDEPTVTAKLHMQNGQLSESTTSIDEPNGLALTLRSSSVIREVSQSASSVVESAEATLPRAPHASGSVDSEAPASSAIKSQVKASEPTLPARDKDGELLANGTFHPEDNGNYAQHESEERMDESKDGLSTDRALEAALQEAVRIEADSHAHTRDEMDVDIEASYVPRPLQLAPELSSSPTKDAPLSPEYFPVLNDGESDLRDRESDDYEPPEAAPPVNELQQGYELQETGVEVNPEADSSYSRAPLAAISESANDMIVAIDLVQTSNKVDSDVFTESLVPQDGSFPEVVEERGRAKSRPETFAPYHSPLKQFRAFRFHPQFKQEIPGGLKSMTYSHKINPGKEFCRFELAGGICNDSTCDLQHFREIGLPDDAVLTALGSPDEFQGEQRDKFCVGLKEVLLGLRLRKIRDFDIIASEIIAHRVKFLGDSSKVLPLEGTTI